MYSISMEGYRYNAFTIWFIYLTGRFIYNNLESLALTKETLPMDKEVKNNVFIWSNILTESVPRIARIYCENTGKILNKCLFCKVKTRSSTHIMMNILETSILAHVFSRTFEKSIFFAISLQHIIKKHSPSAKTKQKMEVQISYVVEQSWCGWISARAGFWDACGEVSFKFRVFTDGGRHLFEKNAAMLVFFSQLLLSVITRKKMR